MNKSANPPIQAFSVLWKTADPGTRCDLGRDPIVASRSFLGLSGLAYSPFLTASVEKFQPLHLAKLLGGGDRVWSLNASSHQALLSWEATLSQKVAPLSISVCCWVNWELV